jgi:hypothetical protein
MKKKHRTVVANGFFRSLNLHHNGEQIFYKSSNNLRHAMKKMQHIKKILATKAWTICTDRCL